MGYKAGVIIVVKFIVLILLLGLIKIIKYWLCNIFIIFIVIYEIKDNWIIEKCSNLYGIVNEWIWIWYILIIWELGGFISVIVFFGGFVEFFYLCYFKFFLEFRLYLRF